LRIRTNLVNIAWIVFAIVGELLISDAQRVQFPYDFGWVGRLRSAGTHGAHPTAGWCNNSRILNRNPYSRRYTAACCSNALMKY